MSINTKWFEKQIEASAYKSVRGLARHMTSRSGGVMDHTSLHRAINGLRQIQIGEARQLADLLGVPMSLVIQKSGVPFGKRDNVPE